VVIETSAVLAILQAEPEAAAFAEAIERDPVRLVSAASVLEASIVIVARYGDAGARELDLFLLKAQADVVPVTAEHAALGRDAYVRFGKGRHPAGLNFGDCFAYALARASGEPLLFKGEDFNRTDVAAVERV
jgi:ribonuclease VapC